MKAKRYLWLFIAALTMLYLISSYPVPSVRANGEIPPNFYQDLDINGTYVYNVTDYGSDPTWWWIFSNEGFWETSTGGQIVINFTGFYNRDPSDWGDVFPNKSAYMDIKIYNKTFSGLDLNFTKYNSSNKEIASALTLGFNDFQAGFLIPIDNLTNIKELAMQEADPGGMFDKAGNVRVEFTPHLFSVMFEANDNSQNTTLVYERKSGILVRADTAAAGYKLEIFLTNFSLDFNNTFKYEVSDFGPPSWWWVFSNKGYWETSTNGSIIVNFTGYYPRDPFDWGDVFPNNIPYMNISIYNHTGISLVHNFTQVNISNKEASSAMTLGFNDFQSGFLLQYIENVTEIKELALSEADPGGMFDKPGVVNIYESASTIKITFEALDKSQNTYLVYEKMTGILLWVNSTSGGYKITFKFQNYTLWFYDQPPSAPPLVLDDINDMPAGSDDILYLIGLINIISIGAIGFSVLTVKSEKFKSKHGVIGTIGVACFASLIFLSYGIFPFMSRPATEPPNENVENITLIVDYRNGTIDRWENITLLEGKTTVFDALDKFCDIEYTDYGTLGLLVVEINGLRNNVDGWLYGVNGERPSYSCDAYNLKDNDIVNWVYADKYYPPD